MATRAELGTAHTVTLPQGRLVYHERGDGSPVVFVHGLMVNADLWRQVVPVVAAAGHRCIAVDWPMGSHEIPMPTADLTPPGMADLIADFLEALDLEDVTLVANDTGGAIVQVMLTRRPERVGRVVLASCDAFERFFQQPFEPLPALAAVPGVVWMLVQSMRIRALHRLPMAFGWAAKRRLPPEIADSYLLPSRRSQAVRRDLRRFLRGVHRRHTLAAAEELPYFTRPVLLAWAGDDRLFPLGLAGRLAGLLPDARLEVIPDSYTFIPEDRPVELAELVVDFMKNTA